MDKSTTKRYTRDVRTASYPDGASLELHNLGAVLFAPRRYHLIRTTSPTPT